MMRTDGYTVEELDALPLLPIIRRGETIAYVDIEHPQWLDTESKFFDRMADPDNWSDDHVIVRRCSSSVKLGKERTFFPLNMFPVTVTKGKATWETSIRDVKNALSQVQRDQFRAQNMPFIRMYVMGDTNARICCPIFNFRIDDIELFGTRQNAWVQHHFRFVAGQSVHKENADPGAILASTDFTQVTPRSREGLKDMARTIFLSATAHDALHRAKRNGDIQNYTEEQLPWALRSRDNWEEFNTFLGQFGHEPLGDYAEWFLEQRN
jgi:hypothetical protein